MAPTPTVTVDISVSEEQLPPFDAAHGTPDPMVRRLITLRLPAGAARFEQTDYGHPGRFNPWEPRGIDPPLQPRTRELAMLCDSIASLLA